MILIISVRKSTFASEANSFDPLSTSARNTSLCVYPRVQVMIHWKWNWEKFLSYDNNGIKNWARTAAKFWTYGDSKCSRNWTLIQLLQMRRKYFQGCCSLLNSACFTGAFILGHICLKRLKIIKSRVIEQWARSATGPQLIYSLDISVIFLSCAFWSQQASFVSLTLSDGKHFSIFVREQDTR